MGKGRKRASARVPVAEKRGRGWLDRSSFGSRCGGSCRQRLGGKINARPLLREAARKATNEPDCNGSARSRGAHRTRAAARL